MLRSNPVRPGKLTSGKPQLKLRESGFSPAPPVWFNGSSRATVPQPLDGAPYASISVSRLWPSTEALVSTRILLVDIVEKITLRQILLLPVTLPLGTVIQLLPSQYCT